MIDSNQLNVLMAVESSSTLSEAADQLGITQSAVSQNLKNIEQKIGFSVVSKVGKKVALTPNGLKLCKLGRNYFRRLDQTLADIHNESKKILGSIHLGTMFGVGKSWVINRMVEFSSEYPDLSLQVKMDTSDSLLRKFETNELDCIVLPQSLTPVHTISETLHEEEIILLYSKEHINLDEKISLKEFSELPFIFFEKKDSLFYNWCRERFGQIPRGVSARFAVNSFGNMLSAVHKGLGVAVVPKHVYNRSAFHGKLSQFGNSYVLPNSKVNFIYHLEDEDSIKIKTLYKFLKGEVDRLVQS